MEELIAYQVNINDNVATALSPLFAGSVTIRGNAVVPKLTAVEKVPCGHKIALADISAGDNIVKYGVVIGRATKNIPKGSWVHLHVMQSIYDERSSHLDIITGAPSDTQYE